MTLVVRNRRVINESGTLRLSADVGDVNVWFRLPPGAPVAESGDAYLAIALLPAMAAHVDLDLTALPPVCPELLERVALLQDIWASWNPLMRRITVRTTAGAPGGPARSDRSAFFSGGVDAIYTALMVRPRLDNLVLVNGFDFKMSAEEFAQARVRVERQAELIGLPLLTIETNWIDFTRHHRIARLTTFGSALAGIGHALSPAAMTIASSNSYARLAPSGSHPLIDPLWSSAATPIDHHGCETRRDEKLTAIATHPELLRDIWVCHVNPVRNCGACPKCLRLRLGLALLGKETLAFPDATDDAVKGWCRASGHRSERLFFADLIAMAKAHGRGDAVRQLNRAEQRVRLRGFASQVDTLLLGGRISRRRRRNEETPDLLPWGRGPFPDA